MSVFGWMNALRRDQPYSSVRGSMEAKHWPLAVKKRIQWCGVMWACTWAARPAVCSVRSDSKTL